jgi:transcriptional regulator with XRE-family HTH domain
MKKKAVDPLAALRAKMRQALEDSGLTQQEVGEKMGLDASDARKAVSRLLTSGIDPRVSTVLKFARAVNRPARDLL